MKKLNVKKIITSTLLFIVGLFIVAGAGYYKASIQNETSFFFFTLKGAKVKPIVYDIANEGFAKRFVQPGKISISTGHGPGLINNTGKSLNVKVEAKGFDGYVNLISNNPCYDIKTGEFKNPIKPGTGINLNVLFDIPRRDIKKTYVSSGTIEITNADSGKTIVSVPIRIINTNE